MCDFLAWPGVRLALLYLATPALFNLESFLRLRVAITSLLYAYDSLQRADLF